jgi:hypothetical protein
MSIRVAALNVTQSDDFEVVLGLINQLSQVLEENRQATNDLLEVADSLGLDDDDTDTELNVRPAQSTRPILSILPKKTIFFLLIVLFCQSSNTETVSNLLERDNESLRSQIHAQKLKNKAYAQLLTDSVRALDKCLSGLRQLVYNKSNESLRIHDKYLSQIHTEQQKTLELELEISTIESKVYEISKILRNAMTASTAIVYPKRKEEELGLNNNHIDQRDGFKTINIEQSPDYIQGFLETLANQRRISSITIDSFNNNDV